MADATGQTEQLPYNAGDALSVTRWVSAASDKIIGPFADHILAPLERRSHALGVAAANLFLTAPRLYGAVLDQQYDKAMDSQDFDCALKAVGKKAALEVLDAVDGPATRRSNTFSPFGAIFDPATDLRNSAGDVRLIRKRARLEGDKITEALMVARVGVDIGAVAIGGVLNYAVSRYAQSRGVELTQEEQPKANALAKVKYGAGFFGQKALLASYAMEGSRHQRPTKVAGQVMTGIGVVAGIASIPEYALKARQTFRRVRATAQERTTQ